MKRVFLIHGWGGYPLEGWRPWLKRELEKRGFEVFVPAMPETDTPTMQVWVPYLKKIVAMPDQECYFVGHSLGCITILRFLEGLKPQTKMGGAVFVAGFGEDNNELNYPSYIKGFFSTPIDWAKIKSHCDKFISIHSDNDPWVSLANSLLFKEKLGATCIIQHNMKHFSGDDGISELPVALESILQLAKTGN